MRIPVESLSHEAVEGLIEEFVTRDGTEYGSREHTLEEKAATVRGQLARGEVVIVFDPTTESANIVPNDSNRGTS